MVDTRDLKSLGQQCPCGFDSRPRHREGWRTPSLSVLLPLTPTPLPSGEGTRAEALGRLRRLLRSHPSLCFTPHLVSGEMRFAHGMQLLTALCAKENHSRTGFGHGASTGWCASTGSATSRTTVTGDGKLSELVWAGNTSGGYFRKTKKTARMRQRKAAM